MGFPGGRGRPAARPAVGGRWPGAAGWPVTRRLAPLLALGIAGASLTPGAALAQRAAASPWRVTAYDADEVATDGVQLVLLGATLAQRGVGVAGVFNAQGYVLHYPGNSIWGITPSLGLRDGLPGGQIQGRVGYTFVKGPAQPPAVAAVAPGGGRSGLTLAGQLDQRGKGDGGGQVSALYNFGAHTLWSRGRLSTLFSRPDPGAGIRLGGEAVFFEASRAGYSAWQVGPTLEYDGPRFVATLSAGPRFQNPGSAAAYVHLDLTLPR